MPRQFRCILPGADYHIAQRGSNRRDVFFRDQDRRVYLDLVRMHAVICGIRIHCYCLMSNHVHLVLRPDDEVSLSEFMRRVQGRYSGYLNATNGWYGHVWHNRFFSCLLDERHFWNACRYTEMNPVRAGICQRPEDYAWSSCQAHFRGQDEHGMLDFRPWYAIGGEPGWRELLSTPEDEAEVAQLRQCTLSGRPCGSDEFLTEMENRFGRRWRRINPGQPKTQAAS